MPTKKPRLTVTLEPDTYWILKQFSEVQDRSMGSCINEILTEVSPALARVTSALISAHSLNTTTMKAIKDDLDDAAGDFQNLFPEDQLLEVLKRVSEQSRRA